MLMKEIARPRCNGLISSTIFRLLRYFSTVLNLFRYRLETHPDVSGFRQSSLWPLHFTKNCYRKISISLKPALLINISWLYLSTYAEDHGPVCGMEDCPWISIL